jgi:hypothetical protein
MIELALAASGAAALPVGSAALAAGMPPQPDPMYPERYLKVLGFFAGDDIDWYESVHAPDFMSFAGPYMARYARNWVQAAEAGARPSYRVITEIQYKSESAKANVRRLSASPAGKPLLDHTMEHIRASGRPTPAPGAAPARPSLFSVSPRALSRSARPSGPATAQRRIFVLRRSPEASQSAFEAAANAGARALARMASGAAVSIDVFGANSVPGPADAMVFVANAEASLTMPESAAMQVLSVLRVETRSSVG